VPGKRVDQDAYRDLTASQHEVTVVNTGNTQGTNGGCGNILMTPYFELIRHRFDR
jgi:hypothetical protein